MSPLMEFTQLADDWAPYYRVRVRIGLAVRDQSGNWQLLFALTYFSPERPLEYVPLDLETKSIRAIRQVTALQASESATAVEETISNPGAISFPQGLAKIASSGDDLNFQFERMHLANWAGPLRIPALTVLTQPLANLGAFPHLAELDHELITCETPYDSLAELLGELRISEQPQALFQTPNAQILLAPPASLKFSATVQEGSFLTNGSLSLLLSLHPNLDPVNLRLGLKSFPKDSAVRRLSRRLDSLKWESHGDFKEARLELEAPNTPLCQAILSHNGQLLGRWWIRDQDLNFNDRLQFHRAVDTKNIFRDTFFEDRNDFEDRVTLLLTLLGLQPLKYGGIPKLTNAPDILAWSSERHLYVIDCITGDINQKGKLNRLYNRTNEIRTILARAPQPPIAVLPMIITSLPFDDTLAHHAIVATHKIALVCRENIQNLFDRLDVVPTPTELYQAALATIPSG